jgi:hypothetical protein
VRCRGRCPGWPGAVQPPSRGTVRRPGAPPGCCAPAHAPARLLCLAGGAGGAAPATRAHLLEDKALGGVVRLRGHPGQGVQLLQAGHGAGRCGRRRRRRGSGPSGWARRRCIARARQAAAAAAAAPACSGAQVVGTARGAVAAVGTPGPARAQAAGAVHGAPRAGGAQARLGPSARRAPPMRGAERVRRCAGAARIWLQIRREASSMLLARGTRQSLRNNAGYEGIGARRGELAVRL